MIHIKDQHKETVIYLVLWSLLFIAPVMSLYIRVTGNSNLSFDWTEVFIVWRQLGLFFAIFLVHNFLLAPLLVERHQRALYFGITAVLVMMFAYYQFNYHHHDGGPQTMTFDGRRPPHMADGHRPPEFDDMHRDSLCHDDRHEFSDMRRDSLHRERHHEFDEGHRPPQFDEGHRPPELDDDHRPPLLLGQHDLVTVILLVLMLLANLGVKLYFRQRRDQQRWAELEHKNLEQQLEYLKYQLNPHFLMNTLNNIHALIDIDPERAQQAVIQLSKILRYVLYDSNHERVPMSQEMAFMKNYTDLMRMRYTDKLRFSVSVSDDGTGVSVPPLIFVSFVENAFKHGVSYREESFIDISNKRYQDKHGRERLLWTCRNSKHQKVDATAIAKQGGVGMVNVRQRLDLIYGDDYTLGINETDNSYEVILDIPL